MKNLTKSTVLLLQTKLTLAEEYVSRNDLQDALEWIEEVEHHLAVIARELRDEILKVRAQLKLI